MKNDSNKTSKIIVLFLSVILAGAMIAGTAFAIYKSQKGEKIGNGKFSIEKMNNKVMMKKR